MTMVMPVVAVEVRQQLHDLARSGGVEVAGRLVGKDHHRIADDRAGDGDALLLAARQLRRVVMLAPLKSDLGQRLRRAGRTLGRGMALVDQRQFDVLERGRAGEQVEALEDEAEIVAAQERPLVAAEARDIDAVEAVGAGGRPVEAADDVHRGRLAGARRPHDGDELALADRQVDAVERAHLGLSAAVVAADAAQFDQGGRGHLSRPRSGR